MLALMLGFAHAADLRVDSAGSFVVVSIDGKLVGATPLEISDVPGGHHEVGFWQSATDATPAFVEHIEIDQDGGLRLTVDILLKTVDVEDLSASPAEAPAKTEPPETVAEPVKAAPTEAAPAAPGGGKRVALNSAVTVAGVGLGGLAAYEYSVAKASYATFLSVPSDAAADAIYEDEVRPARTLAIAAGVGATVALGTAAGLWANTDLQVSPTPGGLILSGSF